MIKLQVSVPNGPEFKVIFEGDRATAEKNALAYMDRHGNRLYIEEALTDPIGTEYDKLLDRLYPTCAHLLSARNCYGPQHYYFDEEEQARGLRNSAPWMG